MKRTNKTTTTTMVRRVSAALLAVCITTLYLALPVKAATNSIVAAHGYYPGTGANPTRYYYCAINNSGTSFKTEMSYGLSYPKLKIETSFLILVPEATDFIEERFLNNEDFSYVYRNEYTSSYTSVSGSYFYEIVSKYYISDNIMATLVSH